MRIKYLLMCILGLLTSSAAQAQSPSKHSPDVKAYVQQPNGELLQIPREYSAEDLEGVGYNENRLNLVVMLRLPGPKSTIRLREGDAIEVWAELPKKIDPHRIELLRFETRGLQRVTYISRYGSRGEGHWNTLSFRTRQSQNGKWLLEPAIQPQAGEYCFTLPSGNEHFCFGVDKR